jgi:mevalonate kinase
MATAFTPSRADAPGSMILMGEYAVLEGAPAVLMTLGRRLSVSVLPSSVTRIVSDRFGVYEEGGAVPDFARLVLNTLAAAGISAPVEISIESAIPTMYGFGSSAALVAALVKALLQGAAFDDLFATGHAAIIKTFGRGSGADLAASLIDAPFVRFQQGQAEAFALPFAVQAIYTGYKTPTPQVLADVRARVGEGEWARVLQAMRVSAEAFVRAPTVEGIAEYQRLMDALGVTCDRTRAALDAFSSRGIAAKISGSGLGDCVAGFSDEAVDGIEVQAPLEFLHARELVA